MLVHCLNSETKTFLGCKKTKFVAFRLKNISRFQTSQTLPPPILILVHSALLSSFSRISSLLSRLKYQHFLHKYLVEIDLIFSQCYDFKVSDFFSIHLLFEKCVCDAHGWSRNIQMELHKQSRVIVAP